VRFAGLQARVKVRVPIEGQRNFVGVLRQVEGGKVQLEVDGRIVTIDLGNLDKARLVPQL
jgi:ribosome maturation factor RimP